MWTFIRHPSVAKTMSIIFFSPQGLCYTLIQLHQALFYLFLDSWKIWIQKLTHIGSSIVPSEWEVKRRAQPMLAETVVLSVPSSRIKGLYIYEQKKSRNCNLHCSVSEKDRCLRSCITCTQISLAPATVELQKFACRHLYQPQENNYTTPSLGYVTIITQLAAIYLTK